MTRWKTNSPWPRHSSRHADPSSSPLCDEPCRGLEQRRIGAKRREGGLGLVDQTEQLLLRLGDAENSDRRRFTGVGVLAGRLSDRGSIAFDVENIVGDLECFSDNGAESIERQSLALLCPTQNRSVDAAIAPQRTRLHRLQLFDVLQAHLPPRR